MPIATGARTRGARRYAAPGHKGRRVVAPAIVLVLMHGWVLFVLGFALIAGIEPRWSAALASVIMLEIVISLIVTGLSDTALRDVGVLGLAVCLTGVRHQRLALRG